MADYNSKFTGPEIDAAIGAVAGKAEKAVPGAAGNVALLDAEGNLTDSGKALTPEAIGALAAGAAAAAGKLATPHSIITDLGSSEAASFDGSEDIEPGVTGILPVAHGGTGSGSIDEVPSPGSGNLVTSGGIHTALSEKLSKSEAQGAYMPIGGGQVKGTLSVGVSEPDIVTITGNGISKAGGSPLTLEDLNISGGKITGLEEPTSDTGAANKAYVDAHRGNWYGTSTTSAATSEKTVKLTDAAGFHLAAGAKVSVRFQYGNSVKGAKLNVASTGSITIKSHGTTDVASDSWLAGSVVDFVYDGSYWILQGINGAVPVEQGGTGLTSEPSMLTDLASTAAKSPLSANPRPGVTGVLPAAHGGTGNATGYVLSGQKSGVSPGARATAEGANCSAGGANSHAEGNNCEARGLDSHAEGSDSVASGECSHAEGEFCTASGAMAHAGGSQCTVSGLHSFCHGVHLTVSNPNSTVVGTYNREGLEPGEEYFVVGGGWANEDLATNQRRNLFRVGDQGIYGAFAYNNTGADYAEFFEWSDGNPEAEDRVGLMVALEGEKVRPAGPGDEAVGITSATPSVIGDSYADQWHGMLLTDIFGRPILEEIDVPAVIGAGGEELAPATKRWAPKVNPDYDPLEPYIARHKRPEWTGVGLMGKLVVTDDGTCVPGGFCGPSEGGIATYSPERTRFRVLSRLDELHVRVLAV